MDALTLAAVSWNVLPAQQGFCGRIQPPGSKVPDILGKRHVQMGTPSILRATAGRRGQTTITSYTIISPLYLNSWFKFDSCTNTSTPNPSTFTMQSPFQGQHNILYMVTKSTKAILILSPCFSIQLSNFKMLITSTRCVTCDTLHFINYPVLFFFLLFKSRISTLITGLTFLPSCSGRVEICREQKGQDGLRSTLHNLDINLILQWGPWG